jgi:hypothetical protein
MHEQVEKSIAQWRQALADKIGNEPNLLDELESHLRDELDRQAKAGQPPELAFQSTITKIGAPDTLAQEFAKVAAPWWPIRAVAAGVLLTIVFSMILLGVRLRSSADGWLIVHVMSITAGYLLTYGIGVLAICYASRRLMRELALGQQTSLVRALVLMDCLGCGFTAVGALTGCVWAHDHLGRFWDFWDVRESGVLIVLGWQAVLLGSATRAHRSLRWLMCWGVLGNLAVTYAWFAAAVLSSARHYESMGNLIIFLVAPLTAILLAIGASALLPSGWLQRSVVKRN